MPPGRRPQDNWKSNAPPPRATAAAARTAGGSSRRWFGAALVLAALAGAIAGLFYYLRKEPEPRFVAIPVTQYEHPDWGPNPWAEADAAAVRDRFPNPDEAVQLQEKDRILRKLDDVADQSQKEPRRPVVVYLCTLGTVADGKPYLVPGSGSPGDPGTWIALDEVLTPLGRTTAPRLLVLDVRPANSPRADHPAADVNEVIDAALTEKARKGELPFLVLTANTPCDGPNVLRPLKRSVFSLAVSHGAAGAADGWGPDGRVDQQVRAKELAAYVRQVTATVTAGGGFAPQVPRLHGNAGVEDVVVLPVPTPGPQLPAPADRDPYPPWLLEAWAERDKWEKDQLHRRAPRVTYHLARAARRAEERWLAGADPKAVEAVLGPELAQLRQVAGQLPAVAPAARTVAQARLRPGLPVAKAEDALAPLFAKIRNPPPPTPEDAKKGDLPAELRESIAAAPAALKDKDAEPFDAAAAALLTFAAGLDAPTHDQVRAAAAAADRLGLRHAEFLTVRLVARLPAVWVNDHWPRGTAGRLIDLARVAEEAAAADGRARPALADRLAGLDRDRRAVLQVLINPESLRADLAAAADRLAQLAVGYRDAADVAKALTGAWEEYEETRAVLADLAVRFPPAPGPAAKAAASAWDDLADKYGRLEGVLGVPDGRPAAADAAAVDRAGRAVRTLRKQLADLAPEPQAGDPAAFERALRWPGWRAGTRDALVGRLDRAAREAADRALKAWPTQPSAKDPAGADDLPPKCSGQVARASAQDVQRVADLLVLARAPGAAELRGRPPAPESAEFAGHVRRVRAAYRQELPKLLAAAPPRRQAAVGWAVDPDDVPAYPKPGVPGPPNPEPPARRDDEAAYLQWLADRFREDAAAVRAVKVVGYKDFQAPARALADGLEGLAREFLK